MKRRSAAIAAVLALAAGLSACATATPYQPNMPGAAVSGGYSDYRLDQNKFRVTFAGNTLTSRETVERYLLYRAAELTVAQGYDWFSVDARDTDKTTRTYIDPPMYSPSWSYGYWAPYWRYYGSSWGWRTWDPYWGDPFWADRMDVRTVERYEATADITMMHGPRPANDPRAFDARQVMANLGPTIQLPAAPRR
jgi:hypothetical protein